MGLNKLGDLYREVILDHAQHPRNQKQLSQVTHQMELLNPTCGDAIIVQCQVEDERVVAVAFTGYGCSISIASASMMTEVLTGQTLERALELVEIFNRLISQIHGEPLVAEDEEALQDAYFLEGLKQFPSRYKCGSLAWKAFEGAFEKRIREDDEE